MGGLILPEPGVYGILAGMAGRMFFEALEDALVGFLPPDLRGFSVRASGRNLKVWYGAEEREHYEVQLVSRHALEAAHYRAEGPVLEIGFHAEHPAGPRNDAALRPLLQSRSRWEPELGEGAEAGAFLGRQAGAWRRISELWEGSDVVEPDAAIEAAERLATYIMVLEPHRR